MKSQNSPPAQVGFVASLYSELLSSQSVSAHAPQVPQASPVDMRSASLRLRKARRALPDDAALECACPRSRGPAGRAPSRARLHYGRCTQACRPARLRRSIPADHRPCDGRPAHRLGRLLVLQRARPVLLVVVGVTRHRSRARERIPARQTARGGRSPLGAAPLEPRVHLVLLVALQPEHPHLVH
eukprot:scaffold7805_cov116-Isochrysis_galbana.AAC.6